MSNLLQSVALSVCELRLLLLMILSPSYCFATDVSASDAAPEALFARGVDACPARMPPCTCCASGSEACEGPASIRRAFVAVATIALRQQGGLTWFESKVGPPSKGPVSHSGGPHKGAFGGLVERPFDP